MLEVILIRLINEFLYWNVRGIDNSDTRIALKILYLSHKPILIFIAEPVITVWLPSLSDDFKVDFFRDRCGLPNYRFGCFLFMFFFSFLFS